jgi:pimeloyl-ACP methyl ester carboxylesterase
MFMEMAKHDGNGIEGDWEGSYAWLSDQPDTDTAVVFVHGFFGDARGTWLNFPGMIDSHVMPQSFWPRADLFFLDYPSYEHHIADNADRLLRFLARIFPSPLPSLFSPLRAKPQSERLISLVLRWEQLQPRSYNRLLLVGHSEGALIIRQAMIDACQRSGGRDPFLNARLALFAPAHRGVLMTGWVQAVLTIARAKRLAVSALEASPAFAEMQDTEFISGVQQSTDALLMEYGRIAFRARMLFGCGENLVRVQVFPKDTREECAADQDHVSVCKPRGEYLTPFAFIERVVA